MVKCDSTEETAQMRSCISDQPHSTNNVSFHHIVGDAVAQQTLHTQQQQQRGEMAVRDNVNSVQGGLQLPRFICNNYDRYPLAARSRCWRRPRLNHRTYSVPTDQSPLPPPASVITSTAASLLSLDQLQCKLAADYLSRSLDKWRFNIFHFDQITSGRSLLHLSLRLFDNYGLIRFFQLDILKLLDCIGTIEAGYYGNNPYHTAVHAADVLQAIHCNIVHSPLCRLLGPAKMMAAILAAASHDVDHPGVNQTFLKATNNPLASLYTNGSMLENHHWRTTLSILHQSRLLDHLDKPTWQTLKQCIEQLIVATDITRHQDFLTRLKKHLDQNTLDVEGTESHRTFALQIALKCADICNPCRPWKISKRWSHLVCEEFYQQGDREKALGIVVSSVCDREINSVADIQIGFMSHIVEPLFVEWQRFSPCHRSQVMLTHLRNNRVAWQRHQVRPVTSPEPSNHNSPSQSRRHSLPTPHDEASRSRDRRHSAPHAGLRLSMGGLIQLGALNECSPPATQSNEQFYFDAEPPTNDVVHLPDNFATPAYLHYLASLADRRFSLNACNTHARRTVMTSRRRAFSLVTPCSNHGNGVVPGHLVKLDSTSSSRDALPIIRTIGEKWVTSDERSSSELSSSHKLTEDWVPPSAGHGDDETVALLCPVSHTGL